MRSWDAALLGAVQGLTEFLPVSSSAHLALMRRSFGWSDVPRALDVALHAGTTASLLVTEWRRGFALVTALVRDAVRHRTAWSCYRPASRLALKLAAATLPAVVAGALYHRELERWSSRPGRLAASLVAGSLPLLLAPDRFQVPGSKFQGTEGAWNLELGTWNPPLAVLLAMGVAQAAALAPGISRSGATIAVGLACGLDRESAVGLSFLLAAPIMVAATVRSLPALRPLLRDQGAAPLLAGTIASFLTGFAGLGVMSQTVSRWGLRPFAVYRLALAALIHVRSKFQVPVPRRSQQP